MMMCGKKEEEQEEDWSQSIHNIETIQHQLLLQQNPTDSYQWSLPQVQYLSPGPVRDHNPYGSSFFNRRAYEGPTASDQLRVLSETLMGQVVRPGLVDSASFGVRAEMGQMRAQEIIDAKAIAASKSHSEAERRRRERINNHLAKLRSLLPSTTKTDKASLLAEVIQHVKELKRQTTVIAESSLVPTELDELSVNEASDDNGKLIIKASLCCEDRSDLLPDLIKALKALRLKTLRAEITTLGGRVRNVLFVTGDEEKQQQQQQENSMSLVQEALKAVMGRASGDESSSSGNVKRQRTNVNVVEHRSF